MSSPSDSRVPDPPDGADLVTHPCSGIGEVVGLQQNHVPHLVREGPPARLCEAWEEARSAATGRLDWLDIGIGRAPDGLPDERVLRDILRTASSAGDGGLVAYLVEGAEATFVEHRPVGPDQPWTVTSDAPPAGPRFLMADLEGGLVLLRASRYSDALADLSDDVSLVLGAPAAAALVSRGLPLGSSVLGTANRFQIIPITGEFEVIDQRGETSAVGAGSCLSVTSVQQMSSVGDALAVLIAATVPTNADALSYAVRKGGHWPRLRGDVPFDLKSPASAYGLPDPVDAVPFIVGELRSLLEDDTASDALVWSRGVLRPAPRPLPPRSRCPTVLDDWLPLTVRGRFNGGASFLGEEEGRWWVVAAACAFSTEPHLFELLARLVRGTPVEVASLPTSCPSGDPLCAARAVERLYSLGLIALGE